MPIFNRGNIKKPLLTIVVSLIMVTGILGITNPGNNQHRMFGYKESILTGNYFIFSIYRQSGYTLTDDSLYRVYKRYLGIATGFYEMQPLKVKQE